MTNTPSFAIQLLGLPTDINSSFLRGTALAPDLIRQALFSDSSNAAAEDCRELGTQIPFKDRGNLDLNELKSDHDLIFHAAKTALDEGPLISLGGDHSVSFPIVRAMFEKYGPINILHFDAHPDLYDNFLDNPSSHASPFARIMENGYANRLVQVGIRTLNQHQAEQAKRFNVEIISWDNFDPKTVPIPHSPLYVSIDLDALDPAFAPGVSHYEPGGLSVREILQIIQRIDVQLIGADVVEYNPSRDQHGMTAYVAAKFVKELAARMSR
jgi:agmatinase